MKLNKFRHVLAVVLLVLLSVGVSQSATKMPSFSLSDAVSGKIVDSKEFEGKALLVTFFATWCPPCKKEVPALIELQDKFEKDGFSVIGLSVDKGGVPVVLKLIEKMSINYPVLMATGKTQHDFGGVVGIPTSFLINKAGNIVKKYPGYIPRIVLENDIKRIMN